MIPRSRLALTLLISLTALCGCAQHYVMKLSNGHEIETATKPKLRNGSFYYKDAEGKVKMVPSSRVLEMAPASMSRAERKSFEQPKPRKPRHWYFLWLASGGLDRPPDRLT